MLTQIERGEPILEEASVAVIVNDPEFDTETQETLVELISKAVNIGSNDIMVTNLNFATQQTSAPAAEASGLTTRQMLLLLLGGLLLLLVAAVVIMIAVQRRRKRRAEEEAAELELEEAERQRQLAFQREIEEHKKKLQNDAMAQAATKESAVAEEVREFAGENPEITAALLRSLLREDQ